MHFWMLLTLMSTPSLAQNEANAESASKREAVVSRDVLSECSSDGLKRVAWTLNMREQALDRRERMMAQREADLVTAQEELQRWIEELEGVRDEIAGMLNLHSDEDKKIQALREMVENMRPKQAAMVLSEVEVSLAVKVIDRMDRSKAGKAMAVMQAAKAAQIAKELTMPITVGEGQ